MQGVFPAYFIYLLMFTVAWTQHPWALAVTRTRRVQHEPQPEGRLGQSDTATDYSTFAYAREGPLTHVLDVQHLLLSPTAYG